MKNMSLFKPGIAALPIASACVCARIAARFGMPSQHGGQMWAVWMHPYCAAENE